ncbi:MAG: T9SS type A sorting domain-containing protein [Bacteroidetes bacterium]|nr:T9SS type A sorting domain-containing protein [Bacteroidota bacterium]
MKLFYLILFLISCSFLNAQIVFIPDANFKAALINQGVDTNSDGEIQVSEAEAVINLNVSGWNIMSLEGIQSFTSLEVLNCSNNILSNLDFSQNLNLNDLRCYSNQLNSLNISQNSNLSFLWCSNNLLKSLDVSENIALETLYCHNNQLSVLDVKNNINLLDLICSNNQLSSLDVSFSTDLVFLICQRNQLNNLDVSFNTNLIFLDCNHNLLTNLFIDNGNNQNMTDMHSRDNPDLNCIQVDDETATYPVCDGFPLEGWCKDAWSSYSELCNLGLIDLESTNLTLYPNPVSDVLIISSPTNEILTIQIYDIGGKKISSFKKSYQKVSEIDITNINQGIYFLKIFTMGGTLTKKFIKK